MSPTGSRASLNTRLLAGGAVLEEPLRGRSSLEEVGREGGGVRVYSSAPLPVCSLLPVRSLLPYRRVKVTTVKFKGNAKPPNSKKTV